MVMHLFIVPIAVVKWLHHDGDDYDWNEHGEVKPFVMLEVDDEGLVSHALVGDDVVKVVVEIDDTAQLWHEVMQQHVEVEVVDEEIVAQTRGLDEVELDEWL